MSNESDKLISLLSETEPREIIPGYFGKVIHSDSMTFVYWDVEEGAPLPEHSHPHEQVTHMVDGQFEITIDGVTHILHPGSVARVPSNAVHSGRALSKCKILDAFSPVREDYR